MQSAELWMNETRWRSKDASSSGI